MKRIKAWLIKRGLLPTFCPSCWRLTFRIYQARYGREVRVVCKKCDDEVRDYLHVVKEGWK